MVASTEDALDGLRPITIGLGRHHELTRPGREEITRTERERLTKTYRLHDMEIELARTGYSQTGPVTMFTRSALCRPDACPDGISRRAGQRSAECPRGGEPSATSHHSLLAWDAAGRRPPRARARPGRDDPARPTSTASGELSRPRHRSSWLTLAPYWLTRKCDRRFRAQQSRVRSVQSGRSSPKLIIVMRAPSMPSETR
jgi:hypothetical protein